MTSRILAGVMVLVLAGAGAAAQAEADPRFEEIVKLMLGTMDNLSTTLSTVQDEETAKAAKPELRKIAGKWADIKKKAEALPPPSKEDKDRLAKQYKMKLEEAQKKLFGQVLRVRQLAGGPDALLEISSILSKKSKE